jgi:hypothetical protein
MYEKGLGFAVIAEFKDHRGFDGVILGHPRQAYHIEFTSEQEHEVGKASTQDHLLVFYVPDKNEWEATRVQMMSAGFRQVPSYNPYWELQAQRSKISMGIESSCKMRRGPSDVDNLPALDGPSQAGLRHCRYFGDRVSACVFTSRLCLSTTRRNSRSIVLNAS